MYANLHAAQRVTAHSTAQLDRENEIIRSQRERAVSGRPARWSGLAALMSRFTKSSRWATRPTRAAISAR